MTLKELEAAADAIVELWMEGKTDDVKDELQAMPPVQAAAVACRATHVMPDPDNAMDFSNALSRWSTGSFLH